LGEPEVQTPETHHPGLPAAETQAPPDQGVPETPEPDEPGFIGDLEEGEGV